MSRSEQRITDASSGIAAAARVLIGMVRGAEHDEGGRSTGAELSLEIDLTGGGKETWTITIERTASSH
jgi:hypothetical protein